MSDLVYSACVVILCIIFSLTIAYIFKKNRKPKIVWVVAYGDYDESPTVLIFEKREHALKCYNAEMERRHDFVDYYTDVVLTAYE